jgi:hypothetical protein
LLVPLVAALFAGLARGAGASPAGPWAKKLSVAIIGDSVAASLDYVGEARALLARGAVLTLDMRVCRRLVQTGRSTARASPGSLPTAST